MDLDLLWKLPLAGLGCHWTVRAFRPRSWGHVPALERTLGIVLGLLVVRPLLSAPAGAAWLAAVATVTAIPWGALVIARFRQLALRDMGLVADGYGATRCRAPGSDLVEWSRPESAGARGLRMRNVLTRVRSIHPGVRYSETFGMMAFVLELRRQAPVQASLMRGWTTPQYFESEWSEATIVRGALVSMSFGDLQRDARDRRSGGDAASLQTHEVQGDPRFETFTRVAALDPDALAALLSDEVRERILASASASCPYELNITPRTVNIHTTYCLRDVQRHHVELLYFLADRLEGIAPAQEQLSA